MKYKVTLNDRTYEVEVEVGEAILLDEYEAYAPAPAAPAAPEVPVAPAVAPVAAPQPPASPTVSGETIDAPMPGTILRIEVTQGTAVKSGQVLIVLEAMKMENEILAPKDCTIAQILVEKGRNVETGTPLIVLA